VVAGGEIVRDALVADLDGEAAERRVGVPGAHADPPGQDRGVSIRVLDEGRLVAVEEDGKVLAGALDAEAMPPAGLDQGGDTLEELPVVAVAAQEEGPVV